MRAGSSAGLTAVPYTLSFISKLNVCTGTGGGEGVKEAIAEGGVYMYKVDVYNHLLEKNVNKYTTV
jgi:hypothetical protein